MNSVHAYCPDLRLLPRREFKPGALGAILENFIDVVNQELKRTIADSRLGPNEKDQALRQVLLALRNTADYYGYKEILSVNEKGLTRTQLEREEKLLEMTKKISEKEPNWKAIEEEAIAFIEQNFDYYLEQPKVVKVEKYIIFNNDVATLRIEGNFYCSEGIELIFGNNSTYKPARVDRNHKYIIFEIKISDFHFDQTDMKNSYEMATLKCPWTRGRLWSSKIEANFDIVLATFPPFPGTIYYEVVAQKICSMTPLNCIQESLPSEYQISEHTQKINWNEIATIHVNEENSIFTLNFHEAYTGQIFSISNLPHYITVQEIIRRRCYNFTVIFPFEQHLEKK